MTGVQVPQSQFGDASAEYANDVDVWTKTVRSPGSPAIGDFLARLFTVLRYGGLYYRESAAADTDAYGWKRWSAWPIAAALGHGGRVMIQLPIAYRGSVTDKERHHDNSFWEWLLGSAAPLLMQRTATHGIAPLDKPTPLPDGRLKFIRETKTKGFDTLHHKFASKDFCRHFGLNIALGGAGTPATSLGRTAGARASRPTARTGTCTSTTWRRRWSGSAACWSASRGRSS